MNLIGFTFEECLSRTLDSPSEIYLKRLKQSLLFPSRLKSGNQSSAKHLAFGGATVAQEDLRKFSFEATQVENTDGLCPALP